MTGRSRNTAAASIVLVLFYLAVSLSALGISSGDDSWYLSDGASFRLQSLFWLHFWSPLYDAWFRMLGLMWHDPISRFFASWSLLVLLLALIPLLFNIRRAWIYIFLVLVFALPSVVPYLGLFAGTLMVLALSSMLRFKPAYSEALCAGCGACFVMGYCRSEFDFGVYLAAGATLVAIGMEWRRGQRGVSRPVIAAVVLLMAAATAFVMKHALGARSGIAFAQHFNYRAAVRGLIPGGVVPWTSDYAERTFGVDPGRNALTGTASIADFFRANPKLFLGHLFANLIDPRTMLVLLAVGVVLLYPWLRSAARDYRAHSLFMATLIVPVLMDLIIIYPRNHYIAMLLPVLTLFALQLITWQPKTTPSIVWITAGGMAAIFAWNIALPRLRHQPATGEQIYYARLQCIRPIDRTIGASSASVFDSSGIRPIFLAGPRIKEDRVTLPQWTDFTAWALRTHPAWVTMENWGAGTYGGGIKQQDEFLRQQLGYVSQDCPYPAAMKVYIPAQP